MKRLRVKLVISGLVITALACAGYGYYRWRYPFGPSHCCDKVLYDELDRYAALHEGWFPRGEASPEASLSLLYRQDPANAYNLRGKSIPESVVRERLTRGELLTPDTCGWQYVEGLRTDDDPRLALFWDKAGLDHFGGRLSGGGHIVITIDGQNQHVTAEEWPAFLEKQHRLLTERAQGAEVRADAKLQLNGEDIQVQLREVNGLLYGRIWRQGYRSGSELLAGVGRESALVGQPVVTTQEVRNAKVLVDREKGRVRFILDGRELVFDGSKFAFVLAAGG